MMQVALRTQRTWWIIPLVTVCAVIAGGALDIEYVMSGFGACKTVVRSSIPSPNCDKSLVVFGKECGATNWVHYTGKHCSGRRLFFT
jgi:hypothetical protein